MARVKHQPLNDEDERFEAAIALGEEESAQDARAASYDAGQHSLILDLHSGTRVIIPIEIIRSLKAAQPDALREIEVLGGGDTLHWETLDISLTTSKLVREAVGHTALHRKAGMVSTPKKAAAGRENGKLGGRPKKGSIAAS